MAMEHTVTLSQAKAMIKALAAEQSLLLLSAPGLGKSDTVALAAQEAGLPVRSLLGTQIAPEDVSGIPRIVGERSVFCPPRILLPEKAEPFCLFLDELPATNPEIQKSFYSLLLERRIGEHVLPPGTWVVAAGNRAQDRAMVRAMSSALINRVCLLHVRVDNTEWIQWARANAIRPEIIAYILLTPEALMRPVPSSPVPFSTPRSWALLSQAMDRLQECGILDTDARRALAFGRLSAEDAAVFSVIAEDHFEDVLPIIEYLRAPQKLPQSGSGLWFILSRMRSLVLAEQFPEVEPEVLNEFLMSLPEEQRFSLFVDLVGQWHRLGAAEALFDSLQMVTGVWYDPNL